MNNKVKSCERFHEVAVSLLKNSRMALLSIHNLQGKMLN